MSADPLQTILALAATGDAVLDYGEVSAWPQGILASFEEWRLLRRSSDAKHVVCDQCSDRHSAEVREQTGRRGARRYFIVCPEAGKVELEPEDLRRWTVDRVGLATAIAKAMSATGGIESLIDGRVWRLGTVNIGDNLFSAVLMYDSGLTDTHEVLTTAVATLAADKTVLLVLGDKAGRVAQEERFAAVVAVASVVRLRQHGVWVDLDRIDLSIPNTSSGADKPAVNDSNMSVTYRGRTCTFSSRARNVFALFRRLNQRPGHRVPFDMLRQMRDICRDIDVADDSIRGAVTRLKQRLQKARMGQLAKCLKTDTVDGRGYAVLDLSAHDSNSH